MYSGFETDNNFYNSFEDIGEAATPNSSIDGELDLMDLEIEDETSSMQPTPYASPTKPVHFSFPPPPISPSRSVNPLQQSYAPIYYNFPGMQRQPSPQTNKIGVDQNTHKNTSQNAIRNNFSPQKNGVINVGFQQSPNSPRNVHQPQRNVNPQQQIKANPQFLHAGDSLPFWTAAPLPFTPDKFPPQAFFPDNKNLTEEDHKRLHRKEAIKKWMAKRSRRNMYRIADPQKSQAANSRQRVCGKFISSEEETKMLEMEIEMLRRQVEEEESIAKSLELRLNQTRNELNMLRQQGLVNGILKNQQMGDARSALENQTTLDPRQSTIDYNKVRGKLKKTGVVV